MNRFDTVWDASDGWLRLALVALVIATVAQTCFVAIYGARPWWRVRIGRALMLKSTTLCVLLWLSLVGTFFVYPDQEQVGALTICAITAAIVYQLVALVLSPRHPERRDAP